MKHLNHTKLYSSHCLLLCLLFAFCSVLSVSAQNTVRQRRNPNQVTTPTKQTTTTGKSNSSTQQKRNDKKKDKTDRNKTNSSGNKTASTYSAATGTANGHGYVDLGLSVKWATCNVGASSPTGYGNYYAWGETSTKSNYTDDNSRTYGKNFSDIAGDASYDAARANWGGSWRLPTSAEIQELVDNCTTKWTTINGVKGRLVTSKRNGKSIFLPAAGCHDGTSLYYAGTNFYYWSSTPDESVTGGAYDLGFDDSDFLLYWNDRYFGLTVRPVFE